MVRAKDVLTWMNSYAPFRYSESWDQCGLQVGEPESPVERIIVALDPGSKTLEEAEKCHCQCLVTHHPLIFRPIVSVRSDRYPGNVIAKALQFGINIIAAHTNLDVARGGTNDQLAALLPLESLEPLQADQSLLDEPSYGGMGRVGVLGNPTNLDTLVEDIRKLLGGINVRIVGEPYRRISRVALCTGSGGSLIEMAVASAADVYITGDLKYHDAQAALEAGLSLIDIGHFASERLIVRPLAEYLQSQAELVHASTEVITAHDEKDPFWIR